MRTDSRLILWGARSEDGASITIFEEMTEEPIEKLEWEYRYPVYIEIIQKEGWKSLEKLPKELSLTISGHFREWFGDLLKEATQKRNEISGTDKEVMDLKELYETSVYATKKALENYATALFLNTRRKCRNCEGMIYQNVEGLWQHEDTEAEINCQWGAKPEERK